MSTDLLSDSVGTIFHLSQRIRNLEAQMAGLKPLLLLAEIDCSGLNAIQITDIPDFYSGLYLVQILRSLRAGGNDYGNLVVNGDLGNNYYRCGINETGVALTSFETIAGTIAWPVYPAAGGAANLWGLCTWIFSDYAKVDRYKPWLSYNTFANALSSGNLRYQAMGGLWADLDPIISLAWATGWGDNWAAGSRMLLYGMP